MGDVNLQYVVFNRKERADEVVRELKELIRKYGFCRLSDLYERTDDFECNARINPKFAEFEYGWTNEEDIHYIVTHCGCWFDLPQPKKLNGYWDKVPEFKNPYENESCSKTIYLVVVKIGENGGLRIANTDTLWEAARAKAYARAKELQDNMNREDPCALVTLTKLKRLGTSNGREDVEYKFGYYLHDREDKELASVHIFEKKVVISI